jgi:hypothetical protein
MGHAGSPGPDQNAAAPPQVNGTGTRTGNGNWVHQYPYPHKDEADGYPSELSGNSLLDRSGAVHQPAPIPKTSNPGVNTGNMATAAAATAFNSSKKAAISGPQGNSWSATSPATRVGPPPAQQLDGRGMGTGPATPPKDPSQVSSTPIQQLPPSISHKVKDKARKLFPRKKPPTETPAPERLEDLAADSTHARDHDDTSGSSAAGNQMDDRTKSADTAPGDQKIASGDHGDDKPQKLLDDNVGQHHQTSSSNIPSVILSQANTTTSIDSTIVNKEFLRGSSDGIQSPPGSSGDIRRKETPQARLGLDSSLIHTVPNAPVSTMAAVPHLKAPETVYDKANADRRIQKLLRPYGVEQELDGTDDWLSTLLVWVPQQLKAKDGNLLSQYQHVGGRLQELEQVYQIEKMESERRIQLQTVALENATLKQNLAEQKDLADRHLWDLQNCRADLDDATEVTDRLAAENKHAKAELRGLNDVNVEAQKAIADKDKEISRLKRSYKSLQMAKDHLESEYTKLGQWASQRERELEVAHRSREQQLAATLDAERADHKGALQSLEGSHRQIVQDLEADHERILQSRDASHWQAIEELNSSHHSKVQGLQRELDGEMERHQQEQRDLQQKMDKIQAEVDTVLEQKTAKYKGRIATLERQMASWNTGNYTPIPDSTFGLSLQTISQQVSNLNIYVPRPEAQRFEPQDQHNYLGRNSRQGNRAWPKFVRYICWQVLIDGFFQFPLGFGALGNQGDGYYAVVQLYQLFAGPGTGGECSAFQRSRWS